MGFGSVETAASVAAAAAGSSHWGGGKRGGAHWRRDWEAHLRVREREVGDGEDRGVGGEVALRRFSRVEAKRSGSAQGVVVVVTDE